MNKIVSFAFIVMVLFTACSKENLSPEVEESLNKKKEDKIKNNYDSVTINYVKIISYPPTDFDMYTGAPLAWDEAYDFDQETPDLFIIVVDSSNTLFNGMSKYYRDQDVPVSWDIPKPITRPVSESDSVNVWVFDYDTGRRNANMGHVSLHADSIEAKFPSNPGPASVTISTPEGLKVELGVSWTKL